MSTSQRVSRGFHRLAVFLAIVPLLIGVVWSAVIAVDKARLRVKHQEQLLCAKTALKNLSDVGVSRLLSEPSSLNLPPGYHLDDAQLNLQTLGCSEWPQTATYGEVEDQPLAALSYSASFLSPFTIGLGITFAVSLAVYGVVRAIGWVIGGFVT